MSIIVHTYLCIGEHKMLGMNKSLQLFPKITTNRTSKYFNNYEERANLETTKAEQFAKPS